MDHIKLSVLSALSHSWCIHSESLLPIRVIKSLVNGIKALFGRYSVSVLDGNTQKLMKEHPNAWFTKRLHKPLSAYNISIPSACKSSTSYVSNKIDKLHDEGRILKVKLAFKQDGSIAPIPMYYSIKPWHSKCLNGSARRSDTDTVAPGEKINCRHIAWAYATKVFGRGKETFKRINTPKKIQSIFANTPDIPLKHALRNPDGLKKGPITNRSFYADGYYFHEGAFSEALSGLVEKYWNMPAGDEKNFYFRSKVDKGLGHAMALRLKKQDGCMKVIFYDPNETLMHKTFLLSEPGLAAHITGKDLQDSYRNIFDGALINIDDRKKSADECDVQCFGGSPDDLRCLTAGHNLHPLFRGRRNG
ncbi:hypothetical protein [Endozoicomonas sp. GU-1]|uniref:hypothetical protein n=1 Tax=Endozoicomonas sp. GU-1 TaxID=3009078 RepID=UPI0022B45EBD|nr:hypothetical protein [Endozoicomonas sp. GU-1]WBA82713.1 hypothetical protein O2T12_06135 [Endozoicomonas sp. GU-1]WBA85644.1 hypothetical protein O3276_20780 [Endozoicomonas sp. GU-1]